MRKRTVVIIGLLITLLIVSPIEVNALDPAFPVGFGVIVEIDPCDAVYINNVDHYIVDVVVPREEAIDVMRPHKNSFLGLPDSVLESEYADRDNEWISTLLYYTDNQWENSTCSSTMFGYYDQMDSLLFTEFKIVVYEEGKEPVVSIPYTIDSLATWHDPTGFKIIYNPIEQTFIQQGFELYFGSPNNGGFWSSIEFIYLAFITFLIVLFGAVESIVYLLGRQSSKAILISLGFNMLVVLSVGFMTFGYLDDFRELMFASSLLLIPGIYVCKIYFLNRYAWYTYKVSILFSATYYLVYFIIITSTIF